MSLNLPLLSNQIDNKPSSNGLPYVNISYANITNIIARDIASSITSSCLLLSINNCEFEKGSFNIIFTNISNNNISTLDLSSNRFNRDEMQILSENLYKFSHLRKLNLSSNNLTSDDILPLHNSLSSCKSLEELDFSNNSIHFYNSERVFSVLQFIPSFSYLNLSFNSNNDSDIPAIVRFILTTCKNKTKVNIKNNCNINYIGYLNLRISVKKNYKNIISDFKFFDLPLITKLNFIFSRNRPKVYNEMYFNGY